MHRDARYLRRCTVDAKRCRLNREVLRTARIGREHVGLIDERKTRPSPCHALVAMRGVRGVQGKGVVGLPVETAEARVAYVIVAKLRGKDRSAEVAASVAVGVEIQVMEHTIQLRLVENLRQEDDVGLPCRNVAPDLLTCAVRAELPFVLFARKRDVADVDGEIAKVFGTRGNGRKCNGRRRRRRGAGRRSRRPGRLAGR